MASSSLCAKITPCPPPDVGLDHDRRAHFADVGLGCVGIGEALVAAVGICGG